MNKKPYEISVWKDNFMTADITGGTFSKTTFSSLIFYDATITNNLAFATDYILKIPIVDTSAIRFCPSGQVSLNGNTILTFQTIYHLPQEVGGIWINTATKKVYGATGIYYSTDTILPQYDYTDYFSGSFTPLTSGSNAIKVTLNYNESSGSPIGTVQFSSVSPIIQEQKMLTIGSDRMTTQSRALDPKLTCDVNGTHQFTFKMYYKYIDTQTGEWVDNEFVSFLTDETKIKLKYDGEWYDLVIKSVVEKADDYSFTYTAEDLYITELSKTGYDIEFADDLYNNMDTAENLVKATLDGTTWSVESEVIPQTQDEALFSATLNRAIAASYLKRYQKQSNGGYEEVAVTNPLASGTVIYIYYSCCSTKTARLQFLTVTNPTKDSDRVITGGTNYERYVMEGGFTWVDNSYYQVGQPDFVNAFSLSLDYRGERIVQTQTSKYDQILQKVLLKYKKNSTDYWGFTRTRYESPATVQNLVSNSKNFSSTVGWKAAEFWPSGYTSDWKNEITWKTVPDLQGLINTNTKLNTTGSFNSVMRAVWDSETAATTHKFPALINSGFNDNLKTIGSLDKGTQYVVRYKLPASNGSSYLDGSTLTIYVAELSYNGTYDTYQVTTKYITFDLSTKHQIGSTGVWYAMGECINSLSYDDLKEKNLGIVIDTRGQSELNIEQFEIFKYVPYDDNGNMRPMWPEDTTVEAKAVTEYCYFPASADYDSEDELTIEEISETPLSDMKPVYTSDCAKIRSITASKSNRFNIIQDICETFECWASFDITHDAVGRTTDKKVSLHNYIGRDNPARFIKGINLKQIQRTLDSKQIVSKLIVQPNSNEFAPGKMCTIAKAACNETGETTIYNFDYYLNQGLIDATWLYNDLYNTQGDYLGYFSELRRINNLLRPKAEELATLRVTLAQAEAELAKAKAGIEGANNELDTVNTKLKTLVGKSLSYILNINPSTGSDADKQIYNRMKPDSGDHVQDTTMVNLVIAGVNMQENLEQFTQEATTYETQVNAYKTQATNLSEDIEDLTDEKEELYRNFFARYGRFIQEGTWVDEKYTDPELYYYDAQSVGFESSMPKVTYSLNVVDISTIEGFEGYDFKVGDRTYIEDTEFFGYVTENGVKTPAKEQVTVSKIVYALEAPESTTITIQNYKSLFSDLFHRITVTVQQVHYATGSYERAAALAEADTAQKLGFLQDALNDAAAILENSADQTVTWDNTGITITDGNNTAQKLRIVSGGILLGKPNNNGGTDWITAITGSGISASVITTGQLNTGAIEIYSGTEPTFRWDAMGITAYDFTLNQVDHETIDSIDDTAGVRFDRFGIYGFNITTAGPGATQINTGSNWHPIQIVDWNSSPTGNPSTLTPTSIRKFSYFELTKEGLYLNLAMVNTEYNHYINSQQQVGTLASTVTHGQKISLGKVEDILYNYWNGNTPYYISGMPLPIFVKVFSVTGNDGKKIEMYDDGTLYADNVILEGNITASGGTIGGFNITTGRLYAGTTPNIVGLSGDPTATSNMLIFAGATGDAGTNAKFYVTNDGEIYATQGKVGLWTIGNPLGGSSPGPIDRYFYASANNYYAAFQRPDYGLKALGIGIPSNHFDDWNYANFWVDHNGNFKAKDAEVVTLSSSTISVNGSFSCDAGTGSISIPLINSSQITTSTVYGTGGNEISGTVNILLSVNSTVSGSNWKPKIAYNYSFSQTCILTQNQTVTFRLYYNTSDYITVSDTIQSGNYFINQTVGKIFIPNISDAHEWTNCTFNNGSTAQYITNVSVTVITNSAVKFASDVIPNAENSYYLGNSQSPGRWAGVYAITGNINLSDRNYKQDIYSFDNKYDIFYDNLLPIHYKFTNGTSGRIHSGFISQDVLSALTTANLTPLDFAGYCYDQCDDGTEVYSLRYDEFIALNTWQIQKLKSRVSELEQRITQLESQLQQT